MTIGAAPSCIGELIATSADISGRSFDGHGGDSVNTAFRCACRCGSPKLLVSGEDFDPRIGLFLGSLLVECARCHRRVEVFDPDRHGYNAETDRIEGQATSRTETRVPARAQCSKCEGSEMELLVRFEYPDDLDDEGIRGREQEFFSWFSARATCIGCGETLVVSDYECA